MSAAKLDKNMGITFGGGNQVFEKAIFGKLAPPERYSITFSNQFEIHLTTAIIIILKNLVLEGDLKVLLR